VGTTYEGNIMPNLDRMSMHDRTVIDGTEGIADLAFEDATYFFCAKENRRAVRLMLDQAFNRRFPSPLYRTHTVGSAVTELSVVYMDYRPDAARELVDEQEARLGPIWMSRLMHAFYPE
jgi:hypothetical protein